jgi:hypothetical protein
MNRIDKSLIDKISNIIDHDINDYDYKDVYARMENVYRTNKKYAKLIMKITIKNNELSFENTLHDTRKNIFVDLFNKTKVYLNGTNRKFSDCIIYLYMIDSYNFEFQDLPFFIVAKPDNKKGILIPDNTFKCHNIDRKCYDWDETKDIVSENCKIDESKKINKLFFRGANTGEDKHNLRGLLGQESVTNDIFDVTIGSHQIPLYEFCKYKYLLNLPGHQPWSYRFKYLFLMNALVINVDLRQNYGKGKNGTWINFFDSFFEDGKDYVNLVYDWYEDDKQKNKDNYTKLLKEIINVYEKFEAEPKAYTKMVEHGSQTASSITQNVVYEAVYMVVEAYAEKIKKAN